MGVKRFRRNSRLILTVFIVFFGIMITTINSFAEDVSFYFGSQEYNQSNGQRFPVGFYMDLPTSKVGKYHIELEFDPYRMKPVSGFDKVEEDRLIFEGDSCTGNQKFWLVFEAISGGEAHLELKEADIEVLDSTTGEKYDIPKYPSVNIHISGEDTATALQEQAKLEAEEKERLEAEEQERLKAEEEARLKQEEEDRRIAEEEQAKLEEEEKARQEQLEQERIQQEELEKERLDQEEKAKKQKAKEKAIYIGLGVIVVITFIFAVKLLLSKKKKSKYDESDDTLENESTSKDSALENTAEEVKQDEVKKEADNEATNEATKSVLKEEVKESIMETVKEVEAKADDSETKQSSEKKEGGISLIDFGAYTGSSDK